MRAEAMPYLDGGPAAHPHMSGAIAHRLHRCGNMSERQLRRVPLPTRLERANSEPRSLSRVRGGGGGGGGRGLGGGQDGALRVGTGRGGVQAPITTAERPLDPLEC